MAGIANWYEIAVAIGVLLEQVGLLETTDKGQPICTTDYPSLPPLLFLAGMHL